MKKYTLLASAFMLAGPALCQETLQSVTTNGSTTDKQITVATTFGGSMYTGRQIGTGYGNSSPSGAVYLAKTDALSPANNYLYAGYYGTTATAGSGTNSFFVRGDGWGYFAGNLGVGTSTPAYKLDVNGDIHATRIRFSYNDFLDWGNAVGVGRFRWSHEGTDQVNLKVQYSGNSGSTWSDGYTLTSAGTFLVGSNEVWHKGNLIPVVTGANPATDFNTINPGINLAGIYRFDPSVVNNPYGYAAGEPRSTSVFQQGNGSRGLQIVGGDYNQPNRLFFRGGGDGGWKQWNEVWNSANFNPANYLPLTGGIITGKVVIGVNTAQRDLDVNGNIKTRRVKVTQSDWPDYVFDSSYRLASIKQVEKYIQQNKHLPGVPSAAEVQQEGVDLGNNQTVLLKKIEELTLYIIEQNKRMEKLEKKVQELEADKK